MTENSTAPSNTGPSFTDQLAARNANAAVKGNGTHLHMVEATGTKAAGGAAATANAGEAVTRVASRMSGGKIAAISGKTFLDCSC